MGEIKDYLSFYSSDKDYESFRKFFDFLDGKSHFSYDLFLKAYKEMEEYFLNNNINKPTFFSTAEAFLQFLFELNVICYMESYKGKKFIHWCFKERNYANLSPKVKAHCDYEIHYGLLKSLNFGKRTFGTSNFNSY